MRRSTRFGALIAVMFLVQPPLAIAQRAGELTLYSKIGFAGQSYTLNGPRQYISLDWSVRSIRVVSGESWELCGRSRYRSPCVTVHRSEANIQRHVASGRPRPAMVSPMPLPAPMPGSNGESLRGMSAEFFPAPTSGAGRVASCATGAAECAAESADVFCRSRGWTRAAYQRQETVAGRIYLADVLCVRS